MNLLHLGCHEVLEYDELKLFNTLPGLRVFSPGAYLNPGGIGGRPALKGVKVNQKWLDAWGTIKPRPELPPPLSDQKASISLEVLKHFDAVYVTHVLAWLSGNWDVFKKWGGPIYYRDIGQTNFEQEIVLKYYRERGVKVIRYSPTSRMIPNYAGEDAMIRFSKDPKDFLPWVGDRREVITIGQSMKKRGNACGYDTFCEATKPFPRKLFGNANEDSGALWGGQVTYQRLVELLSWHRCYFYTGTYPAPYTLNFMEAAMAGCPIVAVGRETLELDYAHYEVPDIMAEWRLEDWCGYTASGLQECVRLTVGATNDDLKQRSDAQRAGAAKLFGYDAVRPLWMELFGLKERKKAKK